MTKETYLSPATELLYVRFEENMMSPQGVNWAKKPGGVSGEDLFEDGEEF